MRDDISARLLTAISERVLMNKRTILVSFSNTELALLYIAMATDCISDTAENMDTELAALTSTIQSKE